ncbi:MAG: ATP phosphoribosyltransferase [Chloroflexota bacterium]
MRRLRLALPKGRLLRPTRVLLEKAGLGLDGYTEGSRQYRLESQRIPGLCAKVFQERDIPVQVAIGNYDMGICGRQWVEELLVRYPLSGLVLVRDLGYARGRVVAAVAGSSGFKSVRDLAHDNGTLRIVSEYPNLAESLALGLRIRRFKVFPVWGAAEAYPPENSEVAVLWRDSERNTFFPGIVPLKVVLEGGACLVANRESWERLDMGEVLGLLCQAIGPGGEEVVSTMPEPPVQTSCTVAPSKSGDECVWLALPDGHQQAHVVRFLSRTGVAVEGYSGRESGRCPSISLPGVRVKVVRPQDMPQQVASGNFDLAVTGQDWLTDHLCRFPSSPVEEVLDLGFGRVRLVAAVNGDMGVESVSQLKQWGRNRSALRIASEYVNLADRFGREHHLAPYRVVPTWGATEAFLPEDADLLIENTETGRTLAEHNLKVIDTLAVSTACLIGNRHALASPARRKKLLAVADAFRKGLG